MEELDKKWTHENVTITDIRKVNKLYIITIKDKEINTPLSVNKDIFNDRLKTYFLDDDISKINREDIMAVKWSMYITKGFYIKIIDGKAEEYREKSDPNKFYISFLEIAGPLGSFESVYSKNKIN